MGQQLGNHHNMDVGLNSSNSMKRRSMQNSLAARLMMLQAILSIVCYAGLGWWVSKNMHVNQRHLLLESTEGLALIGTDYSSRGILRDGCSVTVVLLDPHINTPKALWALESVAANIRPLKTSCVLLQTSVCDIKNATRSSDEDAYRILSDSITARAKKKFRAMIDNGQVRMSIVDHKKYSLKKCNDFNSISKAWLNYGYWGRAEFSKADADLILTIQSDAVLCHPLRIEKWREFAWVSAPWPPKRCSGGGRDWCSCSLLSGNWKNWHNQTGEGGAAPPYPTEDELCTNDKIAPVGNGGLSLRSRRWLRKSIKRCPHKRWSGFHVGSSDIVHSTCSVGGNVPQEDMVFATILRGMGAPLPSAYEASLFAAEMRFPHSLEEHYKLSDVRVLESVAKSRWEPGMHEHKRESGLARYRRMRAKRNGNEEPIVPIGLHKPYRYHSAELLKSEYMRQNCKYLKHIL